jgi:hypothetical protein
MRALTVEEIDDVGGGPWWVAIAWWVGSEIAWYGVEWLVGYIVGDLGAGSGDTGSVTTANGTTVNFSCDGNAGGMTMTLTSGGDTITVGC